MMVIWKKMGKMLQKLWKYRWVLRSILPTIYFNFRYLPLQQAVYLPVFLYKPKFLHSTGRFVITGGVTPGMIQLGKMMVPLYPNNGITIENNGLIEFHGRCVIGSNSFISVNRNGYLQIGAGFAATASLRLTSSCGIRFGNNVLIGWDNLFMDTDFHSIKSVDGDTIPTYGQIVIGDDCWLGAKCVVMKNTHLPKNTIVASNSLLNKAYNSPEKSLLAGSPARVVKTGVYRVKDFTL